MGERRHEAIFSVLSAAVLYYAVLGISRIRNREPQVVIDHDGIRLGFGRNRRFSESAAAQVDASVAGVHAAQMAVAAEVARNYLELRGLQQRFEVAKESLVNQRDTLRLTTARLDAGRGTRLDVVRAQSQYDSTEATLPALQAAIARAA